MTATDVRAGTAPLGASVAGRRLIGVPRHRTDRTPDTGIRPGTAGGHPDPDSGVDPSRLAHCHRCGSDRPAAGVGPARAARRAFGDDVGGRRRAESTLAERLADADAAADRLRSLFGTATPSVLVVPATAGEAARQVGHPDSSMPAQVAATTDGQSRPARHGRRRPGRAQSRCVPAAHGARTAGRRDPRAHPCGHPSHDDRPSAALAVGRVRRVCRVGPGEHAGPDRLGPAAGTGSDRGPAADAALAQRLRLRARRTWRRHTRPRGLPCAGSPPSTASPGSWRSTEQSPERRERRPRRLTRLSAPSSARRPRPSSRVGEASWRRWPGDERPPGRHAGAWSTGAAGVPPGRPPGACRRDRRARPTGAWVRPCSAAGRLLVHHRRWRAPRRGPATGSRPGGLRGGRGGRGPRRARRAVPARTRRLRFRRGDRPPGPGVLPRAGGAGRAGHHRLGRAGGPLHDERLVGAPGRARRAHRGRVPHDHARSWWPDCARFSLRGRGCRAARSARRSPP